jgi:hypothetical protein
LESTTSVDSTTVWHNGALVQQWFWYRVESGPSNASTYTRSTSAPGQASTLNLASQNYAKPRANLEDAFEWHIDDHGQIVEQWFWYRIGEAVPVLSIAPANAKDSKAVIQDVPKAVPLHFYQYSDSGVGDAQTAPSLSSNLQPAGSGLSHVPAEQHFFPDQQDYDSPLNFDADPAFYFRSATVPLVKHKPAALFDAPTEERPPTRLSISVGPDSSFYLKATSPGKLQSATLLNGPETIWQDEGLISNSLIITPLPSQPAVFYRLLPPK